MKFKLILRQKQGNKIPFNYQYPLSSALYKIIQKADEKYSQLLHDEGFGKGFKFFTFSDLNFKCFKWDKEGIIISDNESLLLFVDIYIPKTTHSLIKGFFEDKLITIADCNLKTEFYIDSVEMIDDMLCNKAPNEVIKVKVQPTSPLVVGKKNKNGNYDYLLPSDEDYKEFLLKNWIEKAKVFNNNDTFDLLEINILNKENAKTRLITLKAHTPQETKIRGSKNFYIELIGRKKDIEPLIYGGLGIYNAQGMGSVKIIEI
ncbi:MAG: CRISPR-associated endoribonuclease Cas6 [Flavobacteriaceae bacterium]|nr:CRISPR-associated endoribonuclease Cas6 [Flavobacteriaceae bacterium]